MQTLGEILKNNPYPGRGIALGCSEENFCIAYMLMGRSENSRNRVLVENKGELFAKPFDESKLADLRHGESAAHGGLQRLSAEQVAQ